MKRELEAEHLGSGVVLFRNAVEIDHQFLIPYLDDLRLKAVKEDFTIIHDETGAPVYAINRSGHRYPLEDVQSVNRIMGFATDDTDSDTYKFFDNCEKTIYNSLIKYIELFPMILPSIWWKEQGHVVGYGPGSAMGVHSDNDVNYQPGAVPDLQLAIRHVLGCVLYFNDSVETDPDLDKYEYSGGEISFKYLNIKHRPMSGDILFFPSNYMATHEVLKIDRGIRFAYISYFSHGSSDTKRGVTPAEKLDRLYSGQVWIPELFKDYQTYIKEKYKDALHEYPDLTTPLERMNTSNGTIEEVAKEKNKHDLQ